MGKRNIKLIVEYDGADFHGWQVQPGQRTIQQVIIDAIRKVTGEEVSLVGSGRTDAGVCAKAQVANFLTSSRLSLDALLRAINANLPEDVVVKELEEVPENFHSCYSAKWKTYRYTIYNSVIRSPLNRHHSYWLSQPLDVEKMRESAEVFLGKHDFSSFQTEARRGSSTRTIRRLDVWREGEFVFVEIEASGFLYNMARAIVGTLVKAGLGRLTPEDVRQILESKDRRKTPANVPAYGLCLIEVKYETAHEPVKSPEEK